ncbi:glutamate racemase [Clostridium sp. MB40-C1]|uniref:glutamate racemase n=1 Tax=Clostridium sp. MB40-C1 TaxID=3070996 RepID=UPI0027DFE6E1|nr:glutamate racemase [Clostridium sp. MB40-C1]WMJ79857.1 glutamate racemase [Clostridium sp. MB40-C1]
MDISNKPIGFFDSGVGGLSVLKKSIKLLPNEDFIYLGDSKNAPYGVKSVEEVRKLSFQAVEFLLQYNVKAIVVACNTATSAAIEQLRKEYRKIPIIGIEPALKPAVELNKSGKIVIMATPMTLSEKKFNRLMNKYKEKANIVPLPCPGLVELIEKGILQGIEVNQFLKDRFSILYKDKIASVVLGCTHYPFIKNELSNVLSKDVTIIDGSDGTSAQLKRQLERNKMLNLKQKKGEVHIYNTLDEKEILDISYRLLDV